MVAKQGAPKSRQIENFFDCIENKKIRCILQGFADRSNPVSGNCGKSKNRKIFFDCIENRKIRCILQGFADRSKSTNKTVL